MQALIPCLQEWAEGEGEGLADGAWAAGVVEFASDSGAARESFPGGGADQCRFTWRPWASRSWML